VPEGHTIRIAAARLAPLEGHRVTVRAPQPRHRHAGFDALDGRQLERVEPVGKHLLLHFEGGRVVHSHLRMRGAWYVSRTEERRRRGTGTAWLVVADDEWEGVLVHGPVLELLDARRLGLHPVLSRLGPDLLAPGFDPMAAVARVRADPDRDARSVADVLLDQRLAAGIGNMFKSESLWACRVDPFLPATAVGDEQLAALYADARKQMGAAVAARRELPKRIYGRPACPRCGQGTRHVVQGDDGRVTWWCPRCQATGSGADGREQQDSTSSASCR
jgi:endonuclease VIII